MSDKKDTIQLGGKGEAGTGIVTVPKTGTASQRLKFVEAVRRRQGDPLQEKLDAQKKQLQEEKSKQMGKLRPSFFPSDDTNDAAKDVVEKFFQAADEEYTVGPKDKFYGDVGGELFEKYGLDPKIHGDVDPDKIEDEITQRMEGTGMFEGQKMTQAEAEQDYINFLEKSAKEAKARQDFYADPEKVRKAQEAMDEFSRMFEEYDGNKDK